MPYVDALRYPLAALGSAEPETLDSDRPNPRRAEPTRAESVTAVKALSLFGRSERIRTSDPIVPNDVRYQAALHSDMAGYKASELAL